MQYFEIFQTSIVSQANTIENDEATPMLQDNIISSLVEATTNDIAPYQNEAVVTPEVEATTTSTNQQRISDTGESGPGLASGVNSENAPDAIELNTISNQQSDTISTDDSPSGESHPIDGATANNVEPIISKGSNLKRPSSKRRASNSVTFADQEVIGPEAAPLMRTANRVELSTPPDTRPQNI